MISSAGTGNIWSEVWREQGIATAKKIFSHRLFIDSYPVFKKHFPADLTSVLEVAAGSGRYGLKLAADYQSAQVILTDILPASVELMSNLAEELKLKNVSAKLADANSLPFNDNSFDLVLADCLIQHLDKPEPILKELVRVLRPGGKLILSGVNYWNFHTLFKTWQKWWGGEYEYGLEKSFARHGWKKLLKNYPVAITTIDGAAVSYGLYRLKKYSSIFSWLGKIVNRLVKMVDTLTNRLISRYFGFELIVVAEKIKLETNYSELINLQLVPGGDIGRLIIAESERHIPSPIKRVYFINDVSNEQVVRGGHAHKEIDQVVFCLQGQVQLNLDDGVKQQSLILNSPGWGVRVGPKLWHTLSHFTPHTTVAVIASDFYREDDYLRSRESWQDFLRDHA